MLQLFRPDFRFTPTMSAALERDGHLLLPAFLAMRPVESFRRLLVYFIGDSP
jgi:hypothetical protein